MKKRKKINRNLLLIVLFMLGIISKVSAQLPPGVDPDGPQPAAPIDNPIAIGIVFVLGLGLAYFYLHKRKKAQKIALKS